MIFTPGLGKMKWFARNQKVVLCVAEVGNGDERGSFVWNRSGSILPPSATKREARS